MKIISKHKDYYDYLVGHYGYDEHIVYDRRNMSESKYVPARPGKYSNRGRYLLSICNEWVPILYEDGNFVFNIKESKDPKEYWNREFLEWAGSYSDVNIRFRQPVVLLDEFNSQDYYIPILSEYGIPSLIDAHTIYQKIYAFCSWLKDNPEPPQITDNKSKILAHGFDLKTSFRPKIKK